MTDKPLLVLSGPTASGKSQAALALSRLLAVEIVNADSVQVYRGLDIGAAKPGREERAQVPHHLIDVADPDEEYDAGRFVAQAEGVLAGIWKRGRIPVAVGGTGLYLRALIRGLDPLPKDPGVREALLRRWESEGAAALHEELRRIDPASAGRVHPADRVRVVRALEVATITGERPSALRAAWSEGGNRFSTLFLVLSREREELYRRIDARVDRMFREGLVDEVKGLLAKGYGPDLRPMGALGYRHVCAHLLRGVPPDRTREEMKRDTRRYAKRQMTWLSREPGAVCLPAGSSAEAAAALAKKTLF